MSSRRASVAQTDEAREPGHGRQAKVDIRRTLSILAAATVLAGCSFSYSSKSISDSVSGSSESISDSSASSSPSDHGGESKAEARYRDDVATYTASWVRGGGDVADFQRGLASIAQRHGIADWEAASATWTGIGAGLRSGDATPAERAALTDAVAGGDDARREEIARGYTS